jgi:hypothetical protein
MLSDTPILGGGHTPGLLAVLLNLVPVEGSLIPEH